MQEQVDLERVQLGQEGNQVLQAAASRSTDEANRNCIRVAGMGKGRCRGAQTHVDSTVQAKLGASQRL
jgi:hypothetical protein